MTTIAILALGTGASPPRYYIAVGASQTLGYQPGPSGGPQRPTNLGYAHDLTVTEQGRWPGLRLVRIACPGIRLQVALSGGGTCHHPAGSEVATASAFIRSHPGQVALVTVDLGYPDIAACLAGHAVDPACVADALAQVRSLLPAVVKRLRSAGDPSLVVVGLDHEDPFLADYVGTTGPDPAFAEATAGVVQQFNRALVSAYAGVGVRVAHVGAAFDTSATTPARLAGHATVPLNVKQICTLTWMCVDNNPHPNTVGYRRIAAAVAAAIPAGT